MANKVVDYIELLKMIKVREIKEGTELLDNYKQIWFYDGMDLIFKKTGESIGEREYISEVIGINFEILSESEEIDIESIEEVSEKHFKLPNGVQNQISYREQEERAKINELIRAVKQINRKLED